MHAAVAQSNPRTSPLERIELFDSLLQGHQSVRVSMNVPLTAGSSSRIEVCITRTTIGAEVRYHLSYNESSASANGRRRNSEHLYYFDSKGQLLAVTAGPGMLNSPRVDLEFKISCPARAAPMKYLETLLQSYAFVIDKLRFSAYAVEGVSSYLQVARGTELRHRLAEAAFLQGYCAGAIRPFVCLDLEPKAPYRSGQDLSRKTDPYWHFCDGMALRIARMRLETAPVQVSDWGELLWSLAFLRVPTSGRMLRETYNMPPALICPAVSSALEISDSWEGGDSRGAINAIAYGVVPDVKFAAEAFCEYIVENRPFLAAGVCRRMNEDMPFLPFVLQPAAMALEDCLGRSHSSQEKVRRKDRFYEALGNLGFAALVSKSERSPHASAGRQERMSQSGAYQSPAQERWMLESSGAPHGRQNEVRYIG